MSTVRSWISMILKRGLLIDLLHRSPSRFRALKLLGLMEMQLVEFLRAIRVTISSRVRYHNIPCCHTESIISENETLTVRARTMIVRKVDILRRQVVNVILLRGLDAA